MGLPRLEVVAGGARETVTLPPSATALLCAIAVHGPAPVGRAALQDMLWPDATSERARSCLGSALHRLRAALGDAIQIEDSHGAVGVAASSELTVDIVTLRCRADVLRGRDVTAWERTEVAALEAAVQSRRGAFFENVEGEWVQLARSDCADLYRYALECLLLFHRYRGELNNSIEAAKGLVRDDPYREDAHGSLISLYAEAGQRGRALAQYEACRQVLQSDLGLRPGPHVMASLQAVASPTPAVNAATDIGDLVESIERSMADLHRKVEVLRAAVSGEVQAHAAAPKARTNP